MTPTPDSDPPIQQLTTRTVYQNRWMTLREDQIRRSDGADGIYGVVDKPDFALIIPGTEEGFHLVTQYRYPTNERSLEFPQGTSENDPLKGEALAQAELIEELGLRAGHLAHLGTISPAPGTTSQRCHIYLATHLQTDTSRNPDPEEHDLERTWLPRAAFEHQIQAGHITDGATIAAYTLYVLHTRRAAGDAG